MKIIRGFLKMQLMAYLYYAGPSLGVLALFALGYIIRKKIKDCRRGIRNTGPIKPKGLKNLRNTCYMNAILQNIAWCPKLQDELETIELDDSFIMIKSVLRLIRYSQSKEPIPFDPFELLDAARQSDAIFDGHDQHDSFEMFNTIVSTMEKEIKASHKENKSNKEDETVEETDMQPYPGVRLFFGTLVTVFDHSSCNHVECKIQKFSSIPVPTVTAETTRRENVQRLVFETMGKSDAKMTDVENCIIHGFMRIEEKHMSCKKCGLPDDSGICYTKTLILQPSSILVLHINRLTQNKERKRSKMDDLVTYPETLNIEPFCSIAYKITEEDQQLSYSLFGVVAHSGSLDFGHYVAYIKTNQLSSDDSKGQLCKQMSFNNSEKNKDTIERILEKRKANDISFESNSNENTNNDNKHTKLTITPEINTEDSTLWYYINDATVTACKREEAIDNTNAYILLYVKI